VVRGGVRPRALRRSRRRHRRVERTADEVRRTHGDYPLPAEAHDARAGPRARAQAGRHRRGGNVSKKIWWATAVVGMALVPSIFVVHRALADDGEEDGDDADAETTPTEELSKKKKKVLD